MALWKFTNLNKYGNIRSRIIYKPEGETFSFNPGGLGSFVSVRMFKYKYEDPTISPVLFTDLNGKKFIVPSWKEVLPETTLNDIEWVKPKVKKEKLKKGEWLFESKSDPGHFYKVTQLGIRIKCNCSGQYRAKDRQCRHMNEIKKQLGL